MPSNLARYAIGFLAGALAVAIFHQSAYWLMKAAGLPLAGSPWNLKPAAQAYGLPTLVNQMFWGGLWGILFSLLHDRLPGNDGVKGLLFGMIFPMLLGSWLIVALLKGQPLLSGLLVDGNVMRLRNGFLLNGVAFGLGLGWLYAGITALAGGRRAARA